MSPPPSASVSFAAQDRPDSSLSSSTSSTSISSLPKETVLLKSLAQQMVHYLENMATDPYLRRLAELNDSCVPTAIVTQFAKMQTLFAYAFVSQNHLDWVHRAIDESDRLVLERIGRSTGLRQLEGNENEPFVWAVRLREDSEACSPSSSTSTSFTNVILLRDVPQNVSADGITALLQENDFPSVISVEADVASCWFVTLDTDSHDIMLQCVLRLRTLQLEESYVQCRLRTTTVHHAPSVDPLWLLQNTPTTTKKKRKKKRGKKKKKKTEGSTETTRPRAQQPPRMGVDDFPTLSDKTVEWACSEDKDDDEDEIQNSGHDSKPCKAMSDGASTATTASASTESVAKNKLGAYAAAVVGNVPDVVPEQPVVKTTSTQPVKEVATSPWSKSFAEIVRVS